MFGRLRWVREGSAYYCRDYGFIISTGTPGQATLYRDSILIGPATGIRGAKLWAERIVSEASYV